MRRGISNHLTNVIRFSERGNPRRYTIQLENPTSEIHSSVLDAIRGRHIRFRPRRSTINHVNVQNAPPDLVAMIETFINDQEEETTDNVSIVNTIPVFVAEGDLEDCTVCQDKIKKGDQFRRLPCGVTVNHCFHKDCIDPWLSRNSTCPNCRSKLF